MLPFGNNRAVVNLNESAPGVNLNRNAGRVNLNESFRSVNLNKSTPLVNLNERPAMRSFARLHPHRPADQGTLTNDIRPTVPTTQTRGPSRSEQGPGPFSPDLWDPPRQDIGRGVGFRFSITPYTHFSTISGHHAPPQPPSHPPAASQSALSIIRKRSTTHAGITPSAPDRPLRPRRAAGAPPSKVTEGGE
jgi:hypothetical protein